MAISLDRAWPARPRATARFGAWQRFWQWPALAGVVVLAACLNLLQLTREGYANSYYAAAVKSMLQSWHNFFFVSFDPGGFVTLDKPPLGFWVQTASAKLFGFHGWSILLPQAVAGVLSVGVLFFLVRRYFGPVAGLVAALALAVTPISVVANRNNTIDSQLVLTVLLAAWAVLRATETGKLRWLCLGMALVGLGFNIKMLEAYLVLPALVLVYLVAAPVGWRKRVLHLAAAGAVLLVVSFSWITAVDLTPASQRPYVGSSQHNSELELALGYNGLQRLLGSGGPGTQNRSAGSSGSSTQSRAGTANSATQSASAAPSAGTAQGGPPPGGAGGPGGGGPGGTGENGPVGVFRLLDTQLGGQIGWLIPAALLGLVAAWQMGVRRRPDSRHQSLIVWGAWFLTCAVFFSKALFFHRYYLSMLAPAIAALFGIGAVALWQAYRRRGLRGWLLPLTLAATAAVQVYILRSYPGWRDWLTPLVVVPCAVVALALVVARLRLRVPASALAVATAIGMLALLIAPSVWAADTIRTNGGASGIPSAGPSVAGQGGFRGGAPQAGRVNGYDGRTSARLQLPDGAGAPPPFAADGQSAPPQPPDGFAAGGPGGPGGFGGGNSKQLEQYLLANQGSAKYLVAVNSAMEAEQLILDTGKPVMAMGGFTGSDPILTADSFAALVKAGQVRYVEIGGGGPGGGSSGVSAWVQANCTPVPSSAIQGASTATSSQSTSGLYACSAS